MIRAYVLINTHPGKALEVAANLVGQRGVLQADAITGEYDVIAQVEAEDLRGIGSIIVDTVQADKGVFKTVTCPAVQ